MSAGCPWPGVAALIVGPRSVVSSFAQKPPASVSIEYEEENCHPGQPRPVGYHRCLLGSVWAEPSSEGSGGTLPRREHRPQRLGCAE
jgi:hypothetical protein